jgi:3'(2'), 5'-bisphosphate nucleotidase
MKPDKKTTLLHKISSASLFTQHIQAQLNSKLGWQKDDNSPVTLADLGSQFILLSAISTLYPEDSIYSEENASDLVENGRLPILREHLEEILGGSISAGEIEETINFNGNGKSGYTWFIDPVDGTKGFLRGLVFSIALARMDSNHILKESWMSVPGKMKSLDTVCGKIFSAKRGKGLEVFDAITRAPVEFSKPSFNPNRLTIVASRAHETVDLPPPLDNDSLKINLLSLDSQAKYAALAIGAADIYPRKPSRSFGKFYCWDHAPGALIVEEAGGIATDLAGKEFDWSCGDRMKENWGIFASSTPEAQETYRQIFQDYV